MTVTHITRRACRSVYAAQSQSIRYASSSREPAKAAAAAAAAAAAREVSRQRRSADEKEEMKVKTKDDEEYKTRYNTAARKWVSSIIALPILLVTSYYLFDRLALGNEPKKWERNRELVNTTPATTQDEK